MSGTNHEQEAKVEIIKVVPRRRWTVEQKIFMVEESMQPGNSVSITARKYGVFPNLLYRWRRQMSDGGKTAVAADNEVVSMSDYKALQKKVRQLERVLGHKTLEVEILKEAVRIGREKKLISPKPLSGIEDFQ